MITYLQENFKVATIVYYVTLNSVPHKCYFMSDFITHIEYNCKYCCNCSIVPTIHAFRYLQSRKFKWSVIIIDFVRSLDSKPEQQFCIQGYALASFYQQMSLVDASVGSDPFYKLLLVGNLVTDSYCIHDAFTKSGHKC